MGWTEYRPPLHYFIVLTPGQFCPSCFTIWTPPQSTVAPCPVQLSPPQAAPHPGEVLGPPHCGGRDSGPQEQDTGLSCHLDNHDLIRDYFQRAPPLRSREQRKAEEREGRRREEERTRREEERTRKRTAARNLVEDVK